MDSELRHYLTVIVVLLSLIAGTLLTMLWVSAESMSVTFFIVPLAFGALVSVAVWYAIRLFDPAVLAA